MGLESKRKQQLQPDKRVAAALLAFCTALFAVAVGFHYHSLPGPRPDSISFKQPWNQSANSAQCLACRVSHQYAPALVALAEVSRPTLEFDRLTANERWTPHQANYLPGTPRAPPTPSFAHV